jgi:hypothetical protein
MTMEMETWTTEEDASMYMNLTLAIPVSKRSLYIHSTTGTDRPALAHLGAFHRRVPQCVDWLAIRRRERGV